MDFRKIAAIVPCEAPAVNSDGKEAAPAVIQVKWSRASGALTMIEIMANAHG